MKPLKILACLLAVLTLACMFTACGGEAEKAETVTTAQGTLPVPQTSTEAPQTTEQTEALTTEKRSYLDVSDIDFTKPVITIQADDYAGMYELADKMQNFEVPEDMVIEVYGQVGPSMMTHTIMVPNEAGDKKIGTTFEFTGEEAPEVPADDTPIHIIGVIRTNDFGFNVLVVPAELFEIME